MKQFVPKTQKGKDTLEYIKTLQKEGYKGNIIKAAGEFRERWEENQLPEGYSYTYNKQGLPSLKIKEIPFK